MIEPTGPESFTARTARRIDETPARTHFYRTRAYGQAEFPTTSPAAADRVAMDLLMDQAAAEDATR